MDGAIAPGWYDHPQFGLIRIIKKDGQWASSSSPLEATNKTAAVSTIAPPVIINIRFLVISKTSGMYT